MATIPELNSTLVALQAEVAANKVATDGNAAELAMAMKETDTFYILFAGCLVFIMQAGFATLEAGSVRDKNVRNVLLKNALDACVGALVWYLFGYGISTSGNAFIGTTTANYALSGLDDTSSSYSAAGYDWCAALRALFSTRAWRLPRSQPPNHTPSGQPQGRDPNKPDLNKPCWPQDLLLLLVHLCRCRVYNRLRCCR